MDIGFYIIILFLIMLKLMIWMCVFYSRAQRKRSRIIILPGDRTHVISGQPGQGRDQDYIITNEQVPGYPVGVENPAMFAPPSYDEVQRDKSTEQKPPSYDQVVSGTVMPSTAMPNSGSSVATITTATGVPADVK